MVSNGADTLTTLQEICFAFSDRHDNTNCTLFEIFQNISKITTVYYSVCLVTSI